MTKAEKRKEYRERLKSERRCTHCGKQDSRTLAGKTMCKICSENQRIYKANRKTHKKINMSNSNFFKIGEIVTLAAAEGLSYGQYVSKYHSD